MARTPCEPRRWTHNSEPMRNPAVDSRFETRAIPRTHGSEPMRNPAVDSQLEARAKPRCGLTTRDTWETLQRIHDSCGVRKIIFMDLFPPHYSQKRFERRTVSPTIFYFRCFLQKQMK